MQMQSGATGINAIRIYNPIKQSIDQDPEGIFIKTWVPELATLSTAHIHTPWLAQNPPKYYPAPIVDEVTARREANERLYSIRRSKNFQSLSSKIVKKHASRKKTFKTSKTKKLPSDAAGKQIELF